MHKFFKGKEINRPGQIIDKEFGPIKINYNNSDRIAIKMRPNGQLVVSAPRQAFLTEPDFLDFIYRSRDSIRQLVGRCSGREFKDGDQIGSIHRLSRKLVLIEGVRASTKETATELIVTLPNTYSPIRARAYINQAIAKSLRRQSERYLKKRLQYWADQGGYTYSTIRFNHAKTCWGSCTGQQVISLNIGLMTLPPELIDYVLVHELVHTRHLNHGAGFWREVVSVLPRGKILSKKLKSYTPFL